MRLLRSLIILEMFINVLAISFHKKCGFMLVLNVLMSIYKVKSYFPQWSSRFHRLRIFSDTCNKCEKSLKLICESYIHLVSPL